MTRGKMLDRIKVELAGGIAVRTVFGEDTNFGLPDVKNATFLVNKFVFFYGFSDLGVTNFVR
jgi:ATP-dependent Zn protease